MTRTSVPARRGRPWPARMGDAGAWLWAGAVAPLLLAAAIVWDTVREPSVSAGRQSISLLSEGARGGVLRGAEVLSGVLVLLFAWSLSHRPGIGRALWRAEMGVGVGLALSGLFIEQHLPLPGAFRVPSPWGYLTRVGMVHIGAACLLYISLLVAALAAARQPAPGAGRRLRLVSAVAALLLAALLTAFVAVANGGGPSGWFERAAALVAIAWQEALCLSLARRFRTVNPTIL